MKLNLIWFTVGFVFSLVVLVGILNKLKVSFNSFNNAQNQKIS